MPVRHPLDCALSNLKSGHVRQFENLNRVSSPESVLEAILFELHWFLDLESRFPGRFFYFFQELNKDVLVKLAHFLAVEADERWCDNALRIYDVRSPYRHGKRLIDFYENRVQRMFADRPHICEMLLRFTADDRHA